jgi:hypothetical protein
MKCGEPIRRLFVLAATIALLPLAATAFGADQTAKQTDQPAGGKDRMVFRVVMVEDEDGDPGAAGKAAARKLLAAMGDAALKAVLVSECFEDWEYKQPLLEGICSVIPGKVVFGGATYGSFSQAGCTDFDAVCLLGIGGPGISVSTALVTELGTSKLSFEEHEQLIAQRLRAAGTRLAGELSKTDKDRLCVLVADAHSPKNQYLVEGLQEVLGGKFPITGGSANKNAGQTYVYYQGKAYQDAALALMLAGKFSVSLCGRKAMDNDQVIVTAGQAAAKALSASRGEPQAVLAFNCAGRRGKLQDPREELAAIQNALGKELPLFGCYCAGEVGPLDVGEQNPETLSGGGGWHVMFTLIGQ